MGEEASPDHGGSLPPSASPGIPSPDHPHPAPRPRRPPLQYAETITPAGNWRAHNYLIIRRPRPYGRAGPPSGWWPHDIRDFRGPTSSGQDGVDGAYIDRKGVKRRTGPSASFALNSAPGSPRSSLETNPVARIAAPSSPRFAACSRSASESLYRSRTMHSD